MKICNGSVAEPGVTVDHVNHDTFSEKDLLAIEGHQKHKDYGRSVIKLI